jgi:hypothetical protein
MRERERDRYIFSFSVENYYEGKSVNKSQMEVKQL